MPKYFNCDTIPAQTFFEILKTKDYQQLKPKPKEQGLEAVFIAIYDEFFIKSDNDEAKKYLELTKDIFHLKYKIATLKQTIHFYHYNQTTEQMRIDFAEGLKKGYKINLDLTVPFSQEVKRVLEIEIGGIQNDLSIAEMEFNDMVKKSTDKDFDYFDAIVGIGNVLQGNNLVSTNISLSVYIALEKAAQKEISRMNKKVA